MDNQHSCERLLVTSQEDFIIHDEVLDILYTKVKKEANQSVTVEMMPLKKAVEEVEAQLITLGLQKYGTAAKVAEVLEISPATISRRIKKLLK